MTARAFPNRMRDEHKNDSLHALRRATHAAGDSMPRPKLWEPLLSRENSYEGEPRSSIRKMCNRMEKLVTHARAG
jgi:hypothetical protein